MGQAPSMNRRDGSYMRDGDMAGYWSFYSDAFISTELMAEPADQRVLECNSALGDFLVDRTGFDAMAPFSFFPPAMAGRLDRLQKVPCQMTGGRTFLLDKTACAALGWPSSLHLDLAKLGWGSGQLELRPEIKGGGTLFERTRLNPERVRLALADAPHLLASFEEECQRGGGTPRLMASRLAFMKRMVGGQSERNGCHGAATSRVQLGRSAIKFVPVWTVVRQSASLHDYLDMFSKGLPPDAIRCDEPWVSEIRFTPGTVRAVYFETARSDDDLIALASRVSRDDAQLHQTLEEMIQDARRYLELAVQTTVPGDGLGYTWIKVCDINEKFNNPEQATQFRNSRKAWFFAKDEVIVGGVGKFFTDMESFFGKNVGYHSASWADLQRHHELYFLAVLRDHVRICARFLLACELHAHGAMTPQRRRAIPAEAKRRLIAAINASSMLHLSSAADGLTLSVNYPGLHNKALAFSYPASELAELAV